MVMPPGYPCERFNKETGGLEGLIPVAQFVVE